MQGEEIDFSEIYSQIMDVKSSLENLNSKNFNYFVFEGNNKKIKLDSKDAIPKLLEPLIKQSYSVTSGKFKLSKESLILALEDYMPIPDEKWKEVAKLLYSKNIKIAELNEEEARAHYECQDNMINFSKKRDDLDSSKSVPSALNYSKLLTSEEEKKLAKLMNNPETRDFAFKQLVTSNLRLVVSIAKKYLNTDFDLEELVQEGVFGLIKSINKFDYSLGNKFSTYATWWIRQSIGRSIAEKARTISIPLHVIESINKLVKVEKNLILEGGVDLTAEKISKEMQKYDSKFTVQKIRELKKLNVDLISFDKLGSSNEAFKLSSYVKDVDMINPFDIAVKEQQKEDLEDFLDNNLNFEEAEIIKLHYGLNGGSYSIDEIIDQELFNSNNDYLISSTKIRAILKDMKDNKTNINSEVWKAKKLILSNYLRKTIKKSLRKLKKISKNQKYRMIFGFN